MLHLVYIQFVEWTVKWIGVIFFATPTNDSKAKNRYAYIHTECLHSLCHSTLIRPFLPIQ